MIFRARPNRMALLGAWLCGLGLAACADFSRGDPRAVSDAATETAAGDGGSLDGAAVSFAVSVHPLLVPSCRRCHSDGAEAGDTLFLLTGDATADFAATSRFVEPAAPASSRLLSKMGGTGHGGGTVYAAGSPEYQTVLRWIQQGARP